jgi:hypothetical protein
VDDCSLSRALFKVQFNAMTLKSLGIRALRGRPSTVQFLGLFQPFKQRDACVLADAGVLKPAIRQRRALPGRSPYQQ